MNERSEFGQALERRLTWSSLLSSTYRLYWQRFWTFFLIGLPPALLAYCFKNAEHFLIQRLKHEGWLQISPYNVTLPRLATALAITFAAGSVYWSMSTLFFAAIAEDVRESDLAQSRRLSDAYTRVREQIGVLLLTGLITWTLFQVTRTIAAIPVSFLMTEIMKHFGIESALLWAVVAGGLPWIVIAGLLSRFALAIPLLMENDRITVREAIRMSIRKTDGWELFFMLFLAKSAILGYAIYLVSEYGFNQLWQHTSIGETLYYWLTWAFYTCMAAMLESPIFIAFSILHRELKATPEDAMAAPAIG